MGKFPLALRLTDDDDDAGAVTESFPRRRAAAVFTGGQSQSHHDERAARAADRGTCVISNVALPLAGRAVGVDADDVHSFSFYPSVGPSLSSLPGCFASFQIYSTSALPNKGRFDL